MSTKHPVVSVTGSSGAGTTFVKKAFEKIFDQKNLNVCVVEKAIAFTSLNVQT